ncbi:uncharacterized protein N0V96_009717 [Colletotrichum fioriniae]|uniref:uncharacterized protein n=1 Tax=Colletotrichum fioriniae TaxID=710243 RepID=UPI0032DA0F39|nr:hypothetical protein N0V96_009717 [Colletotrichum fioriniae]
MFGEEMMLELESDTKPPTDSSSSTSSRSELSTIEEEIDDEDLPVSWGAPLIIVTAHGIMQTL